MGIVVSQFKHPYEPISTGMSQGFGKAFNRLIPDEFFLSLTCGVCELGAGELKCCYKRMVKQQWLGCWFRFQGYFGPKTCFMTSKNHVLLTSLVE